MSGLRGLLPNGASELNAWAVWPRTAVALSGVRRFADAGTGTGRDMVLESHNQIYRAQGVGGASDAHTASSPPRDRDRQYALSFASSSSLSLGVSPVCPVPTDAPVSWFACPGSGEVARPR